MDELRDLYNIYQSNIKDVDKKNEDNTNFINVGDMVVASYNNREVRGEVFAILENRYELRGKNGSKIKVTINDIMEHYPKNRRFENKAVQAPPVPTEKQQSQNEKPLASRRKLVKEFEDEENENSPEDQIDLTANENIKVIGKVIQYKNIKYSEIQTMFEKRFLSKDKIWYCLTEKTNEIHVVRNNDSGFRIQEFAVSLVDHFTKQNKPINEGQFNKIKVKGNDNFAIISNVPPKVYGQMLNSLVMLLSK